MKAFLWIVGLVVLLIVGTAVYLFMNSGQLLKQGIESIGPELLGATVKVEQVDLSMTEGKGTLAGLTIGNPPGYEGEYAIRLGSVAISIDAERSTGELMVIKSLELSDVDVATVVKGYRDTNLQALADNVEQATTSQDTQGVDVSVDVTAELDTRVIVESFTMTNGRASVTSKDIANANIELSDIRLVDVGAAQNGVGMDEAVQHIVTHLTKSVSMDIANKLGVEELEERVADKLREKVSSGLRSLANKFGHPE